MASPSWFQESVSRRIHESRGTIAAALAGSKSGKWSAKCWPEGAALIASMTTERGSGQLPEKVSSPGRLGVKARLSVGGAKVVERPSRLPRGSARY